MTVMGQIPLFDAIRDMSHDGVTPNEDELDLLGISSTKRPRARRRALAQRFIGQLEKRGLTLRAASRETTVSYSALRTWLCSSGSRLRINNLTGVAAWLGIGVDEAIRLQGGSAEEGQRTATAASNRKRWEEVARDPQLKAKRTERAVAAMNTAVRGTHQSKEHRQKISAELKSYRRGASAHELHVLDVHSIEIRLMSVLRNHLRRSPGSSQRVQRAWAEAASERYDVCIGTVITAFNRQLEKSGMPRLGGHPANVDRCERMRGYLSSKPKRYRMWAAAPAPEKWADEHARGCPALRKVLRNARGLNQEETPSRTDSGEILKSVGLSGSSGTTRPLMLGGTGH